MSRNRKKKNRITHAKKPAQRSYKARKKGGRYVYPAGTFSAQRRQLLASQEVKAVREQTAAIRPEVPVPEEPAPALSLPETQTQASPLPFSRANIALVCAIALAAGYGAVRQNKAPARLISGLKLQADTEIRDSLKILDAETVTRLSAVIDLDTLQEPLKDYLKKQSGTWAVYLKNMNTSQELKINCSQMESASLIKLFVAGAYLEAVDNGTVVPTAESENALNRMITWSDNNAWTRLETIIGGGSYEKGIGKVNEFIQKHGFKDSGRLIGADSIYSRDATNMTSPDDIGRLLDEVYTGTYVSKDASEKLLSLMEDQHLTSKIPSGLPDGVRSANKTGELSGIENDAAIVFGQNTDYILVVMSEDNYAGIVAYPELSAMIYRHLNPGLEETDE